MTLIEFHPPSNSHITPGSPEAPEADTRCGNEFQTSVGFPTAASSSFLHVPVEKAGGNKTILNPPFLPASPGAFGIPGSPNVPRSQGLFGKGAMTGSCLRLVEKEQTKEEQARGRAGM